MQKLYYILIILLFGHISFAQNVKFDYDYAGNRIRRSYESGPLPVTLISFTATKVSENLEGSTALLNWQTTSETNADRFDVERSQDGKKWINIGNVKAEGDKKSSSWYTFSDMNPMEGENLFRLKMIDKDGTFTFSRIQSLDFGSSIVFFPNPVKDRLKIKGAVSGKLQLLNNKGQVVHSSDTIPADGIDISNLPSGMYLVKITHHDGVLTIKKIVKH